MTEGLLDKAHAYCLQKGFRFTTPREYVLKALLDESRPMGAYDILQKMSNDLGKLNPPTVYRAIQFWHREGFIHCIESLKSYVVCSHGKHIGQTQFLICSVCGFIKELDGFIDFRLIEKTAAKIAFTINSYTIEIKGVCVNCE